jgi:hypothetical protein
MNAFFDVDFLVFDDYNPVSSVLALDAYLNDNVYPDSFACVKSFG